MLGVQRGASARLLWILIICAAFAQAEEKLSTVTTTNGTVFTGWYDADKSTLRTERGTITLKPSMISTVAPLSADVTPAQGTAPARQQGASVGPEGKQTTQEYLENYIEVERARQQANKQALEQLSPAQRLVEVGEQERKAPSLKDFWADIDLVVNTVTYGQPVIGTYIKSTELSGISMRNERTVYTCLHIPPLREDGELAVDPIGDKLQTLKRGDVIKLRLNRFLLPSTIGDGAYTCTVVEIVKIGK